METNDYKVDLEYLYAALLKHPSIVSDEKKKMEIEHLYLAKEKSVVDYDGFIDAATELSVFFQDGHTNIEIPYTAKDLCLNLNCCWGGVNCDEFK